MIKTFKYGHESTMLIEKKPTLIPKWAKFTFFMIVIVTIFFVAQALQSNPSTNELNHDLKFHIESDAPNYLALMFKLRRGFLNGDFDWLANELYTEDACQYFPVPGSNSLSKACGRDDIAALYGQIAQLSSVATIIYKSEDKRIGFHDDRFFVMDFCLGSEYDVRDNINAKAWESSPEKVKEFQKQNCFHDVWAMRKENGKWKVSKEFQAGFWYWDQPQGTLSGNAVDMQSTQAGFFEYFAKGEIKSLVRKFYTRDAIEVTARANPGHAFSLDSLQVHKGHHEIMRFYELPSFPMTNFPTSAFGSDVMVSHFCIASPIGQCAHDFMYFENGKTIDFEFLEVATEGRPEYWTIYNPD